MSNSYQTIYIFNLPQDAYLVKSLLESCDIEVYLKDELTIQSDNFLSNALNGVKLQVPASQVEEAIAILIEHGYIDKDKTKQDDIWGKIGKAIAPIPVLNRFPPVVVAFVVVLILLLLIVGLFIVLEM